MYDVDEEQQFFDHCVDMPNAGQSAAFEAVTDSISRNPSTAHFFLQGPGGTGKTHLYKVIASHYWAQGHVVLCVASSGVAALLLPGGRTAHSRFKIPLDVSIDSRSNIRQTRLIIWDEVPMQNKWCFNAVHATLCDLMEVSQDGTIEPDARQMEILMVCGSSVHAHVYKRTPTKIDG